MFTLSEAEAHDRWITTLPGIDGPGDADEEDVDPDDFPDFTGNDA